MGNNRSLLALDNNFRDIQDSSLDQAYQGDYLGGMQLVYKGFARPGSFTSDSVWQIAFIQYDGSGNLDSITWPQLPNGVASSDYVFVWDDRASYTYS